MNIQDLELRHLVTFKEVAARRSFGKAAAALGYTQSAVSQQIGRLESVLGQSLFHRPGGPKPVDLTGAGALLLPRVDGLIAQIREIEHDFTGFAEGKVGRLAVGTFQSISVRLLPAIVSALNAERPELQVDLVEFRTDDGLREALENRELDVMFWVQDDRLWNGFEVIPLFEDEFVVIAPAGTAEQSYGLQELAALPMIGQHDSDQCQRRIDAGLRTHGVEPRYVFRSGDNSAVQAMVRAGQGVAIMPTLAVDMADPGVVFVALDPPIPPRTVVLVTRSDARRSPAIARFIELATEKSADLFANA
jgi:DNA-binding transcriptional LysR family regulator